jgi:hypothetical protein
MGRVFLKALLWSLGGAVILPLILLVPAIGIYAFTSACGRPGDSGGCEMGLASIVMAGVPAGAILFFLVTLIRGAMRLDRNAPPVE